MKNTHGGKRPNQTGRPPERGETKVPVSLRITPTLKAYLDQCEGSAGNAVEDTVRRSKAFREWEKTTQPHLERVT